MFSSLVPYGWTDRWSAFLSEHPDALPARVVRHDGAALLVATPRGIASLRLSREEPDAVLSDDGADGADASVGRLVNEQDVVPGDDEVDTEAADVGKDWGGLTQEEQAMHIEPE